MKDCDSATGGWALSVAVTVNMKVPAVVGVPESVPSGASVSPAGAAPVVTAQVYGAKPPVAVNP